MQFSYSSKFAHHAARIDSTIGRAHMHTLALSLSIQPPFLCLSLCQLAYLGVYTVTDDTQFARQHGCVQKSMRGTENGMFV